SRARGSPARARGRGPGRVSLETHDGPAARERLAPQDLVGVDGDRIRDALEQRQIVARIAVEPACPEGSKVQRVLAEPFEQALDLALAEARRPVGPSRKSSVLDLELGREQVVQAELARDRRRDERVGRGHDRAQVTLPEVPPYELPALRADHRLDLLAHEL